MIHPKDTILGGVETLKRVLTPNGFRFCFRGEEIGSGGAFASGEFTKDDRRFELHFRFTLGLVTYHFAEKSVHHETYMRELGVWEQCLYPGFSENPLGAFDHLAHDLNYAQDFLSGSGEILLRAEVHEVAENARRSEQLMAAAVGDTRNIEQMKNLFRQHRYGDVLKTAAELKYPARLTASEKRMIDIAGLKLNGRIG